MTEFVREWGVKYADFSEVVRKYNQDAAEQAVSQSRDSKVVTRLVSAWAEPSE